jgi:hypothetical protein
MLPLRGLRSWRHREHALNASGGLVSSGAGLKKANADPRDSQYHILPLTVFAYVENTILVNIYSASRFVPGKNPEEF